MNVEDLLRKRFRALNENRTHEPSGSAVQPLPGRSGVHSCWGLEFFSGKILDIYLFKNKQTNKQTKPLASDKRFEHFRSTP